MPAADRISNDAEARPHLARGDVDLCAPHVGGQQAFAEPALAEALALYRGGLEARRPSRGRPRPGWLTGRAAIRWLARSPGWAATRGIAQLTGLTLAAAVVDWRRFASARAFMGFAGLIPTEYSSGSRTRRGHITKAGPEGVRTALIEAARAYRYRPAIGATLRRRQDGLAPETLARSWKARQRLHATYRRLTARGKPAGVAVVAAARELAGFV